MRNTAVKEIYKQVSPYLNCFEGKKKKAQASLHHQNAFKYFLYSIHHIQALKNITNKKTKQIHQKG